MSPCGKRQSISRLILCVIAGAAITHAEVEILGVRGDYESAFEQILKDEAAIEIRHPGIARLWGRKFLFQYGFDDGATINSEKIPISQGPYTDQRAVVFALLPKALADQASYKRSTRGVSIESISYNTKEKRFGARVVLCAVGVTRTSGALSFPCDLEEYRRIVALNRELRVRMRLTMRIHAVEGISDISGVVLALSVSELKVQVFDMLEPILERAEDVRFVSDRKTGLSDTPGGKDLNLDLGGDSRERTTDSASPAAATATGEGNTVEQAMRLTFGPDELEGLSYSEGLQPWRRGWFLKEGWPGHKAPVIAVCSHVTLPATATKGLTKPLPPGTYKVSMRTMYYRSRFFDSIVRIRLGDDEVETCYWYPNYSDNAGPRDWVLSPALRIAAPADRITITAIQIGGGDRSQAPPYFRRWIAFDRFFITNVMADTNGDLLAKARKKEEADLEFKEPEE